MNKLQQRLADKRANEEAGFTLIELLVVIVILGILAAVVVFSVRGIANRGNEASCKATKAALIVADEAFYAQNGSYAADVTALTTSPNEFLNVTSVTATATSLSGVQWTVTRTAGTPPTYAASGAKAGTC